MWSLLVLGLAMVGGSCSDSTGPRGFQGTYVLTMVDGAGPLPRTLIDHTFRGGDRLLTWAVFDSIRVLSDTLLQRSERSGGVMFQPDGSAGEPMTSTAAYPGRYTQRGNTIVVRWTPLGSAFTDTLLMDGRRLSRWQKVGLICTEGCPPLRLVQFVYEQR